MRWVFFFAIVAGLFVAFVAAGIGNHPSGAGAIPAVGSTITRPVTFDDARSWPEENAALFGVAVGVGVFVIGTLVVIATKPNPPAS